MVGAFVESRGVGWWPLRAARLLMELLVTMLAANVAVAEGGEGQWYVSLGSYQQEAQATTARDDLALEEARILPVELANGRWYRVVVGPFASAAAAAQVARQWQPRVRGAFSFIAVGQSSPPHDIAGSAPTPAEPASQLTQPEPVRPSSAPIRPARQADPLGEIRLDPATTRLLTDDAALQRELERLSRGLPAGLGREIDAARQTGVSLRTVRERAAADAAPTTAPPGYQLHRLHREAPANEAVTSDGH